MDWKKWYEKDHPLLGVIGVCVATATVVVGIMTHECNLQLAVLSEQDARKLENYRNSIERGLGHDKYLDVRTLVGRADEIKPLPGSRYFDDLGIYVPPVGKWVYSESTELDLVKAMGDSDVGKDPLSQKLMRIAPIHLWRTPETLAIKGYSGWKNIFPYAYFMRVSIDDLRKATADAIGLFVPRLFAPPTQNVDSNGRPTLMRTSQKPTTKDVESFVQEFFRGDIAGVLLSSYLSGSLLGHVISPRAKSVDYELLNVQKVHNVVYCATRQTLVDISVQNTFYHHYYIYGELMIISDGPDAVLVTTFVPSSDPSKNSEYFYWVDGWFRGLQVLLRAP